MISNLPKGALPDPPDPRDYKIGFLGAPKIDWQTPFQLPVPPDSDQAQADCCVAEAWSYYHWQLKGYTFSVRSLFAYIAQGYGAVIRDGGLKIKKSGQETQLEAPDPSPKTPQNMRSKEGLDLEAALDDIELNSFVLPDNSIDGVAWGIKNYKGVVFGVQGTNEGWKDLLNPSPPAYGTNPEWGHALYAMGYHLHDGKKCIIAKSSWCNTGIKEHHIKDNYFVSGNTFSAWTLIPKGDQPMTKKFLVNDNGKIGVLVLEGFTGTVAFAKSEQALKELKDAFEVPDTAKTITIPQ
jgi:hypothetical protein